MDLTWKSNFQCIWLRRYIYSTKYFKGPILEFLYMYGELIIADDRLDNSQQLHNEYIHGSWHYVFKNAL